MGLGTTQKEETPDTRKGTEIPGWPIDLAGIARFRACEKEILFVQRTPVFHWK